MSKSQATVAVFCWEEGGKGGWGYNCEEQTTVWLPAAIRLLQSEAQGWMVGGRQAEGQYVLAQAVSAVAAIAVAAAIPNMLLLLT